MKKTLQVITLLTTLIATPLFSSEAINDNTVLIDEQPTYMSKAYKVALGALDDYIYQPMISTFTEKSIMSMEISKLVKLLQDRINATMIEFIKAGKEAKSLQQSGANKIEIRKAQSHMADIFYQLRPAEPMLRQMYPKLNGLFDQLIALRENLDYSIIDTDIIVKDPNDRTLMEKILGK